MTGPAAAPVETTAAADVVVPPVEPMPAVADPPADMPKVSSLVAKVEDAIEESAAASETTMPRVEVPAVDTPAVDTPAVEAPSVETPAVEAPSVETPAVEVNAPEAPAVSEVAADVGAKVDEVVAGVPDVPSAEVNVFGSSLPDCVFAFGVRVFSYVRLGVVLRLSLGCLS